MLTEFDGNIVCGSGRSMSWTKNSQNRSFESHFLSSLTARSKLMSTKIMLELCNHFYNPTTLPKCVSFRVGYVVGLEKGLYNSNRIAFDTKSYGIRTNC